jgi:hypothetical protein
MSLLDVFEAELTPEEAEAGFAVGPVNRPDGVPGTIPAAIHTWGDPSHRLVKTRGRYGPVFQLQAFGRRRTGTPAGGANWLAERYWPARYGLAWVLDRLREHLGRPQYRPLIDLDVPSAVAGPQTPAESAVAVG